MKYLRILSYLIILIATFSITGCAEHSFHVPIVGKYCLVDVQGSQDDSKLGYEVIDGSFYSILGPCVFEVAIAGEYIIAKQHPHAMYQPIDSTVTEYYLVKIFTGPAENFDPTKDIAGPFPNNSIRERYGR